MATAIASSVGLAVTASAVCVTPYTSVITVRIDTTIPFAISMPKPSPASDPMKPATALSPRKRYRI